MIKLKPISKIKTEGEARDIAINFQQKMSEETTSYSELAEYSNYFETLGKKFKLTEEFRENGII